MKTRKGSVSEIANKEKEKRGWQRKDGVFECFIYLRRERVRGEKERRKRDEDDPLLKK